MNALTSARPSRDAESSQVGEISAAWQIAPDALLVLGWRQERLAADGAVARQGLALQRGRYRCLSWPAQEAAPAPHRFLAALRMPPGPAARPGETLLLTSRGDAAGDLAHLPARFLDAAAFGAELARLAGTQAALGARFLLETFAPAATRGNTGIRAMLATFLEKVAAPDGCVEIVGAVAERCAVLQGWGVAPAADCDVIVLGESVERHAARVALFARSDLDPGATGQVLVLPDAAARAMRAARAVVLADREGLRWRPLATEARFLSEPDTVGHLRDTLPGLRCGPATRALLRAALRPRFDGRFTLHDGGHPVRLAVDLAATAPSAGIYLTGWLYDPAGAVAEVQLCNRRGGAVRLDTGWARIRREDVTEAFRADPTLPRPVPGRDLHGFAVHARDPADTVPGESFFLDVSFRDGQCGFVPLALDSATEPAVRDRLLASVDMHKPSAMQVIEGHLAPFFARLPPSGPAASRVIVPIPPAWSTAVVVPLSEPTPPRALLAQFLREGLDPGEGLVFVAGDDWTDAALDALRGLARLYGVEPALLRSGGVVTAAAALDAVTENSSAGRLLLLGPGTVGRSAGWRRALHAALDAETGPACVSPTVIYEDESIRFAGTGEIEILNAAPFVRVPRRLSGMPAGLAADLPPAPSATGSLTCCLMPRAAVPSLRLAADLVGPDHEAALFLRLRQGGVRPVWTPTAQVYATEHEAGDAAASRAARLVGGWCLRAQLLAKG